MAPKSTLEHPKYTFSTLRTPSRKWTIIAPTLVQESRSERLTNLGSSRDCFCLPGGSRMGG